MIDTGKRRRKLPKCCGAGCTSATCPRRIAKQVFLTLAQDTSMSRSRGVAEFFLEGQGMVPAEGTLLQVTTHPIAQGDWRALSFQRVDHMLFGDLSWISKFPDEEETLVSVGTRLCDISIKTISADPLVELVECSAVSGWNIWYAMRPHPL
mmetsp:Transcript_129941/g.238817  ORF Transcript_129941/g.238817 Transcript_129941/m.238817 type:complete len:151 (+) Transcript_129941:1025-1477(+)